jgi:Leucine-rich repeat (LRR) protein
MTHICEIRKRLLVAIAASLIAAVAGAAIPASERAALIALYNAAGGGNWTNHTGWLGAAGTECTWFGVRCTSDQSAVAELELYNNSLTGTLSSEIGNLSQLQRLSLFSNALSGPVPSTIGRLTRLTYLALGDNQFAGTIPPELGNLTNVEFLSFNGDLLDGPIPADLGRLQSVQVLDLSFNRIQGSIPRELGQLQKLTELDLNDNQLSGPIPPELGSLIGLRTLTVAKNRLSGPIPAELGQLTRLESISLSVNQLSGPIPVQLANLTQLQFLSLGQNQLTGSIPMALSRLTNLAELVLSINQLTGTIPPELAQLKNLQRLNLDQNALTGSIPPELGGLSNLLVLAVDANRLTGTLPHELTSLTKLVSLSFYGNRITGTIPDDISRLQDLSELVAFENQLSGTIPPSIGSLTKLRQLLLGGNQFTGTIPPSITNLTALTFLDLRGNQLTGQLPADIDRMSSLENISVPGNRLSGSIPPSITRLSALTILRLEDNDFSGTIPPAIVDLAHLDFLGLRNNHLEGTIPNGIGRMTTLRTLWLGGNQFSGTIPAEIGALTNLGWIDLGNNRFTGSPPRELQNLVNLSDNLSDFRFNALTTTDATLIAFMNRKQDGGDWLRVQTLPPSNVTAASITDRSAIVSWNLATYFEDDGGYQLSVNGSVVATTASKQLSSALVRGLKALTNYLITVRTVTHPHGLQQNTLTSDPTPALSITTGPAVIAPPEIELSASPEGLVERNGLPANEDSFTLSNVGDVATAIALTVSGDFFAIAPSSFSLSGGGSQTVRLTSLPKPAGAYSGEVTASGTGVPSGFSIPVHLLSVAATSGDAVAQPVAPRIDIAGALTATARFINSGTAMLTAIAVSDAAWIVPAPDLITIAPGAGADVRFTIVPAKRPPTDGALAGSLRLVYLSGSPSSFNLADPAVSISTVTVVFTPKPEIGNSSIPSLAPGEVARFIPGVVNVTNQFVSDLFVSNAFGVAGIRDLRLYLGTSQSTSVPSVATFQQLDPSQSLQLAGVVNSVYSSNAPIAGLLLRTTDWDKLLVNASIVDLRPSGSKSALPVFRSDRATSTGGQIVLPGVERSDTRRTDLLMQETAGNNATAKIEIYDPAGKLAGDARNVVLTPYGFTQISDVASIGGTAIVTSIAGQFVAYALVTDSQSGERWPVVDWAGFYGFTPSDPMKVAFARGTAASGRRRVAPHAVTPAAKTDITIFNIDSDAATATVTFYPAGVSRDLAFAARETKTFNDVVSLIGGGGPGYIVVTPVRGHFAVSSPSVAIRSESSGLRLGQRQTFAGIESTAAETSGFGAIESAGKSARIRATLVYQDGRSVYATVVSRDYAIAARGTVIVDDVVMSILGSRLELHNLQVTFQIIEGDGAVTPFLISNGRTARLE